MSVKIVLATTVSQSVLFYSEQIPYLSAEGYNIVCISSPGPELQAIMDKGARPVEVPMERGISLLKDFRSLWQMIAVFRREKPYMVHSMTPKAGLICMLAAKLTGVPVRVHTFTGLIWPTASGLKRLVVMLTDRLTCFCATYVIPEGTGVMNDLRQHITSKPMRVLGYGHIRGVDLERFSRSPEVMAASERFRKAGIFTFLFVGRIVKAKGISELVSAFLRVNSIFPGTRLLLAGPFESEIYPLDSALLAEIRSNPAIEGLGPIFGPALPALYSAADCFVLPSYREGVPTVVLEAGAMGLPCIVTDINGSREIIENGRNGIVIPSKDADALSNAMLRMLENPQEAAAMAQNARPMIASRYSQAFVRRCLFDFYDEIIK